MLSQRGAVMHDLALQVGQVEAVEIGQVQFTDAGGRQVERHRRTEPAEPDHQHPAGLEPQLALDIDLLEQDLPTVTQQFFVTEHAVPR